MLLCDFHIHTTWSDGSLGLEQTVDIFGQAGFDAIAITDHVVNGDNSIGKVTRALDLSVTGSTFNHYLADVRAAAGRAWDKYGMLVIKEFVPACLDYEDLFLEAKRQDALTVACHPHTTPNAMEKDTLYLWNNREKYAKYIDAWEVANRDDVFNVVSLKRYPYIANSDFHKARHLYSWKTLLNCEKNVEAVKQCIRHNRGVAITLFRN